MLLTISIALPVGIIIGSIITNIANKRARRGMYVCIDPANGYDHTKTYKVGDIVRVGKKDL